MYNFVHLPSILLYILYCTTVCTPSILLYCVLYLFFCTVYSIYSTVLCTPSILLNYVLHLFYCTMYSIYSTVLCTLSILLYCMYFVIHSSVLSTPFIFKSILLYCGLHLFGQMVPRVSCQLNKRIVCCTVCILPQGASFKQELGEGAILTQSEQFFFQGFIHASF